MGKPCGKYLVVMLDQWLPLLETAGDLDKTYAADTAKAELAQMSAATVARYLKLTLNEMGFGGISTTKPAPGLRNSIRIRTVGDEHDDTASTRCERVQGTAILAADQITEAEQAITGMNPADPTRQINQIQSTLIRIAKMKTEALAAGKPLDLQSL